MPYLQYPLSSLRTLLTARWDGAAFWTTTEADRAINAALRQWNLATGYWKGQYQVLTVANQVTYTIPVALLHQLRITWQSRPVRYEPPDAMDLWRPNWPGDTTASGRPVPSVVTRWIPCGLTAIDIWPADATGNSLMTVDGILRTPTLTSGTDLLDLGAEDLDALLGYALQRVAFKGPKDRYLGLRQRGLAVFYQAAARHNPRLLTIPALQPYFPQEDRRRTTRPPVGPPGEAAANVEATP